MTLLEWILLFYISPVLVITIAYFKAMFWMFELSFKIAVVICKGLYSVFKAIVKTLYKISLWGYYRLSEGFNRGVKA